MISVDQLISGPDLYLTTLPTGEQYAWRLLTMREYRAFSTLRANQVQHDYVLYARVFERCYQGEEAMLDGRLPAGIFISIGELIMWMSGDAAGYTDKADFEVAQSVYPASSLSEHMKHVVYAAFPSYTIEDVDSWTRQQLFQRFLVAEQVLIKRGVAYEPLEVKRILTPEDVKKKAKSAKIDYAKENAALEGAVGGEHVLDQDPAVLGKKMQKARKLETLEAKKLERLSKAR